MQSIITLSEFAGHLRDLIPTAPHEKASWTDETFGDLALKLFALQYEHNQPYRRLCEAKRIVPNLKINDWKMIPAVPTSAFKDLELSCLSPKNRTTVFHSSGTTEHRPSRHFHNAESLALYEASVVAWFTTALRFTFYDLPILCLTPPRQSVPHSSLVYMFETLRRKIGNGSSAFVGRVGDDGGWTVNLDAAVEALRKKVETDKPIVILGTAFSFVHLLDYVTEENISFKLPAGSRVMETGGYKGRSRSLPKDELHQLICERFGIPSANIICEYGMSELSSQAYDQPTMRHQFHIENPKGIPPQRPRLASYCPNGLSTQSPDSQRNNPEGIASFSPGLRGTSYPGFETSKVPNPERVASKFDHSMVRGEAQLVSSRKEMPPLKSVPTRILYFPPWARAQIISPETGLEVTEGETGLIRVFDLANVFSVMAIQTEDLGIRRGDGFELVGRASLAEARGCSLMAV